MNAPTSQTPNRIHPMMMAAAGSVTLVSLLGVAALTGILPSSHSSVAPVAPVASTVPTAANVAVADLSNANATTRYVTADGKVLEVVPQAVQASSVTQHDATTARSNNPAPVAHRRVVHHTTQHYAQNTYSQPVTTYQQPYSAPQQHPVVNYVNDMHPVGTGVGAVVGGLLGNQVGGGNGKKLATVAGVLMGGYAGNEIAHNRSPLPGQ